MEHFKKLISLFLALLFVLQLLPMQYLGMKTIEAFAAETNPIQNGYEFDIPKESDNTVTAEIPETFIDNNYRPINEENEIVFEMETSESEISPTNSDSGTDTEPNYSAYVSSPYVYNNGDNESISLASGELTYRTNDYILPGRNGLDLVIGRQYNSADATLYKITSSVTYSPYKLYVKQNSNEYFNNMYGLGQGWKFAFTSVQRVDGMDILHLADGRSYVLLSGDTAKMVLSGQGKDEVQVLKYTVTIEETGEEALYTIKYKNGKTEYLSSGGRIIYIKDLWGNRIKFRYDYRKEYPWVEITDSLDRVTIISSTESDTGNIVTVSLPDGISLEYNVYSHESGLKGISSYQDAEGNLTSYSYSVNTLQTKGNSSWTDMNNSMVLSTIIHPTQSQTKFEYETIARNIGNNVLSEYHRVVSRFDVIGSNIINEVTYDYPTGTIDSSGKELFPEYYEYYIEASYSSGLTVRNTFNGFEKICEQTKKHNGTFLEKTEYEYDWSFYIYYVGENEIDTTYYEVNPSKITTYKYNSNQTQYTKSVEVFEYDGYDNVKKSWSTYAEGDDDNTEYLTEYSYGQFSNLLDTMSYKANPYDNIKVDNYIWDYKYIKTSDVYLNNSIVRTIDYTYDSYGNILTEKHWNSDKTAYELIEYTYKDGAYLIKETHENIVTSDGSSAIGTPGNIAGKIVFEYDYDSLGRMTSSTDGNGNVTTYTYDALGNVTSITNPDNTTVTYTRNYADNYVIVEDENYEEDENGISNGKGAAIKYTYTPLGLEYETVDALTGNVITHKEYDSSSRLTKVYEYVYGSVTEYTYDCLDRVTSETVKQGDDTISKITYFYEYAVKPDNEDGDELYNRVTKTVVGGNNAPSVVTTEYTDKHGNVAKTGKIINGVERFDTYTYDYIGNRTSVLTAADTAKNLSFTAKYEYNHDGQVTKTYNANNQYTSNGYDAFGNMVSAADYAGTPTTYTYDSLNRLIRQTITVEQGETSSSKYEYDGNGNIIREWKQNNIVGYEEEWAKTEYTYDNRNRLTSVKQYNDDTVASTTSYTYDGVGNVLTMTAGGKTTAYTYDRFGNVLTETDALGQTESYEYSDLGKLEKKTDRNGIVTTYGLDALGRTVSVSAEHNGKIENQTFTYTKTGQILAEANGNSTTTYSYDDAGRVIIVEEDTFDLPETLPANSFLVTFDTNGGNGSFEPTYYITGETYENLPIPTKTGYTFAGWGCDGVLIEEGDTVGLTENATFVAEWVANTYTITFHSNNGMNETRTQQMVYDTAQALLPNNFMSNSSNTFKGWATSSGGVIKYADEEVVKNLTTSGNYNLYAIWRTGGVVVPGLPDNPGDLMSDEEDDELLNSEETEPETMEQAEENVAVESEGEVILEETVIIEEEIPEADDEAVTEPEQEESTGIELTAFVSGDEEEETPAETSVGYIKTYSYDLAGNRTGFTLEKSGETVHNITYSYDNLNRLSTVSANGAIEATYTYDTNGNRATLTLGNGVVTTYSYNLANWVTNLSNKNSDGEVLSSYDYTYYASGSQRSINYNTGKIKLYTYDDLGRIIRENQTKPARLYLYTYDEAGNRTQIRSTLNDKYTIDYTYDDANRLLTEVKTSGSTTETTAYTYDANGNTISVMSPGSIRVNEYNLFNQLVATNANGSYASYSYNTKGIRTAKSVNSVCTSFLLDGGNVVGEIENGEVTATYLRGANLLSTSENDETSYYLFNAHGDVTGIADDAQTVTKSYEYDAFGIEKEQSVTDTNPFRYCGEYYDTETGTYYLRARYYDPSIGRFTQQDTHWNTANMIYGDNPNKINEREDALSLKQYTYVPSISSIMQSGNLYVYCGNNPVIYLDTTGNLVEIMHYKNPDRAYGHVDLNINGTIYSFAAYGESSKTIRASGKIMVVDKQNYIPIRLANGDKITGFKINLSLEEEQRIQNVIDGYINDATPYIPKRIEYIGSEFFFGKEIDGLDTYNAFGFNCIGFTRKVFADANVSLDWWGMPAIFILNYPNPFKYALNNSVSNKISEGVEYAKSGYANKNVVYNLR